MRPSPRPLLVLALLLGLAEALRGQEITLFPIPTADSNPLGITAGPDGNLWFTEFSTNKIGRITPAGVVTEFPIPTAVSGPTSIAAGPDGNLWFTENVAHQIGRITPAGVITEFPIPTAMSDPFDITAGPDGNLWFTEHDANKIGRITTGRRGHGVSASRRPRATRAASRPGPTATSGSPSVAATRSAGSRRPASSRSFPSRPPGASCRTSRPGPTATSGSRKSAATRSAGSPRPAPSPSFPSRQPQAARGITAGADGNLWFTEHDANQIGRITTAGVITEFPIPTAGSTPFAIAAGPDGNLWFTDTGNDQIGRITTEPTVQTPPLGEEFQVNTDTTGAQLRPDVASTPAGDFVVVWESGTILRGQRFDAAGAPAGAEFPIGAAAGSRPAVAASASGFVVAWNDTATETVVAQRFDPAGAPQGTEFPVSASAALQQFDPKIAMGAAGDFVVVWSTYDEDDEEDDVFGRRFGATGTPLGADFQLNTVTNGYQFGPDVALDASGAIVVVWENEQDSGDTQVYGRRYDDAGAPLGGQFLLTGSGACPSVGRDAGGGFVATWNGLDGDGEGVFGRRFDASGSPLAPAFQVNTFTTNDQGCPRIAMSGSGGFVVTWGSEGQDDPASPGNEGVFAQRYDSEGSRLGFEFQVNTYTTGSQDQPSAAVDGRDGFVIVWHSPQDGSGNGIFGKRGGFPDARPMKVDERVSGGSSDVNGVLESGERVTVDPAWANPGGVPQLLSSAASNLNGPAGPLYTLHDAAADYGTIAAGATNDCFTATADCLEISVSGARPASHWDATFQEALPTLSKTWSVHVGESFSDAPRTNPFYRHIEALFHNLVTVGCGGTAYCPGTGVTRQQMAVFLLRARYGVNFVPPPPTGTVFPDVPLSNPFAAWIELLAAEGITAGCGGGNYCPTSTVTRRQMAVFLLKTRFGSSHVPPAASGIFGDVPANDPTAPWIEELYGLGITGGCSVTPLLFCPDSSVTRGQMAAFLVKTFSLELYGP